MRMNGTTGGGGHGAALADQKREQLARARDIDALKIDADLNEIGKGFLQRWGSLQYARAMRCVGDGDDYKCFVDEKLCGKVIAIRSMGTIC